MRSSSETLVTRLTMEVAVALFTAAIGAIAVFGSVGDGIGWDEAGPQSGYFPFYIGLIVIVASRRQCADERFLALRDNPLCLPPRVMPDELGPLPRDSHGNELNAFERCNLWLLNSALACGIKRTRFICLWNGSGGDGPGGTAHMMDEVQQRTGQVTWLDTRKLW